MISWQQWVFDKVYYNYTFDEQTEVFMQKHLVEHQIYPYNVHMYNTCTGFTASEFFVYLHLGKTPSNMNQINKKW